MRQDTEKKRLRAALAAETARLDADYLADSDARMFAQLCALPALQNAGTVFCYVSVGAEPDTRRLIAWLLQNGKLVCVPRCGPNGVMEAVAIESLSALQPAPYGLLEPGPLAPALPPEAIDFSVVPCVACDEAGCRLGHGAGYYDRFLPRLQAPSVCLCRGRLLQKQLPREAHDHRCTMVLTEEGLLLCG